MGKVVAVENDIIIKLKATNFSPLSYEETLTGCREANTRVEACEAKQHFFNEILIQNCKKSTVGYVEVV